MTGISPIAPDVYSGSHGDAGQMQVYLNYAREHWSKAVENPPVDLNLCANKGGSEAHYALQRRSNAVLATKYQAVLQDEKLLADELEKTRRPVEAGSVGRGDAEASE